MAAALLAQQPWLVASRSSSGASTSSAVRRAGGSTRQLLQPSPIALLGQHHRHAQHLPQHALSLRYLLQRQQRQRSRCRQAGCLAQAQQPPPAAGSGSSAAPAGAAAGAGPGGIAPAPAGWTSKAAVTPQPVVAAAAGGPYAAVVAAAPEVVPAGSSSSSSSGSTGSSGGGPPEGPQVKEEPEVVLLMIACGIGLATGGAIVAFNDAVHFIRDVIWEQESLLASNRELLRNIAESELWPKVVFPPFLGGLAVGALGFAIGGYDDKPAPKLAAAKSSSGSGSGSTEAGAVGTAAAEGEWKQKASAVLRPVSRAVAAAITLGTGASLGPEGPSVDIGKSTAQGLGSTLRSKQRHLTSLLAAGAGAGVAAGFNAPIAGVFFAVETVLQKQKLPKFRAESDPAAAQQQLQEAARSLSLSPSALTIAMVLLAAVLAAVVSQLGLGSSPAFRVPEYRLESLYELPLYLLFGAICGVVSASCSFSTRVATDAFDELREQNSIEAALMPCIGGLTTGVLALGYPEILYQGFDNVNNILSSNGAYAPGLLIQIVVMKVIATSICRGSGLQGGLYAPSIFIGAALGTAYGLMAHTLGDPAGLDLSAPQAYALVGVAAMLASNCQVPLTSVLLLFELTRDYLIILPTLAAVGISFWVSSLAAPSVKNAAAARRMSAAAAASAAVATTQLNPAATEAVLVGSLQRRLAAASNGAQASASAQGTPAPASAGSPHDSAQQGPASAVHAAVLGSSTGAGFGLNGSSSSSGSFDGFDIASAPPAQLAAAAARAGELSLPVSAALERSCLLVEADMAVTRALELMHADDQHVAVVLGGDGSVMGLVTRDVLEECVSAAAAATDVAAGDEQAAASSVGSSSSSSSASDATAGGSSGPAA